MISVVQFCHTNKFDLTFPLKLIFVLTQIPTKGIHSGHNFLFTTWNEKKKTMLPSRKQSFRSKHQPSYWYNYNEMQCYSTALIAILMQGFVNPLYRYTFAQFPPSFLSPAKLKNQSLLISVAALSAIEDKSVSFYS